MLVKMKTDFARQPCPVEVLPDPLNRFVVAAASSLGVSPPYVMAPLLAALAAAIGNTHVAEAKPGWPEPAILWTMIVGRSGTLKSPSIDLALQFIREHQDKLQTNYEKELRNHEAMWELRRQLAPKKRSSAPEAPVPPLFVFEDSTTEALAEALMHNPRGLIAARDEIGGWFKELNRYGQAGTARMLEAYRGGRLRIDRKTRERPIIVSRASVSIAGGIQPRHLQGVLGRDNVDNGMAARFLMTWPSHPQRRWTSVHVPADVEEEVRGVFSGLLALEFAGLPQEPMPHVLRLTSKAAKLYAKFFDSHNEHAEQLEDALRAAWSKLEGAALRLALVVHLSRTVLNDTEFTRKIDAKSMSAGIRLARWFREEARYVYRRLALR